MVSKQLSPFTSLKCHYLQNLVSLLNSLLGYHVDYGTYKLKCYWLRLA